MVIIYLLLFLLVFVFYVTKQHAMVLISMTAIITNFFGVLETVEIVQKTDLLLLPTIFIVITNRIKNPQFFRVKGDRIALCIVLILIFISLEFVYSVLFSVESLIWAFKLVRMQFILLIYFYLRQLDTTTWKNFFRLLLIFSVFHGFLFYLQLVGVTGILYKSPFENAGANLRYGNYPDFTIFFIVYYIAKKNINTQRRIIILLFWGVMILLSQSRGPVLGIIAAFVFYIITHKNKKIIPYIVAGVLAFFLLISPMISKRDMSENASSKDDIALLVNSSPEDMASMKTNQIGTIAFRFGMLAERWLYLKENPKYIPFGVGCIHEQSPANRFFFYLGTVNEKYDYGRCMIDSGDITWVPLLLRYGVVGVIIYFLLLYYWLKISYRSIGVVHSELAKTACLLAACITVGTIGTTLFDSVNTLFYLCIYLGMLMSDNCFREREQVLSYKNSKHFETCLEKR